MGWAICGRGGPYVEGVAMSRGAGTEVLIALTLTTPANDYRSGIFRGSANLVAASTGYSLARSETHACDTCDP